MHESFVETPTIQSYWQYLRMINWTEPWLLALGGFHAVCLLIIVLTRGHLNIQMLVFLALLTCIFCAEYINQFAAERWRLFAEDQHFDSQGMFISTVLCLPIIFNCCVLVILWLFESISLLKICIRRFKKTRIEQAKQGEKNKKE